jgi:hypothetical protein
MDGRAFRGQALCGHHPTAPKAFDPSLGVAMRDLSGARRLITVRQACADAAAMLIGAAGPALAQTTY